MKRTGPPQRKAPLRAKPEATRAFNDRNRGSLARTGGLDRAGGPARSAPKKKRPQRPKEGPLSPAEHRRAVASVARLRCMVSGRVARDADDAEFDAHHPLPKGALRARRLFAHVWDPRNGEWLWSQVHLDHEYAPGHRIPREWLRPCVWEFAAEMDRLGTRGDGPQWATELVKRRHPAAGSSGTLSRGGTNG